MSISRLLADAGLFVITDSRAKRRISDDPEVLRVRYVETEDMMQAISDAAALHPAPLALILETGQAMVLSESGKGGIAIQGAEGSQTEEQIAAVQIASDAIRQFYGIQPEGQPAEPVEVAEIEPSEDSQIEPAEVGSEEAE